MSKIQKTILISLVILAAVLRLTVLDKVPPSLHADESAEGFNAYSLLKTGKDMYGQTSPLLFRANGSYQPPIYTYLSVIPTAIWGNGMFTIRFISALSGIALVILSYFLVSNFATKDKKEGVRMGLIGAGIIAIAPWSIHFSRLASEANLGVLVFGVAIFLLLKSLKNILIFPWATLFLGIASHAYYSERVIVVLFLGIFLVLYRKVFIQNWKFSLFGLFIFGLVILPHLYLLSTGALTKRMGQVSYVGEILQSNLGFFEKYSAIFSQFINHYLIYLSPKNLFFDPGTKLGITTTDIGVFYSWLILPFLAGLRFLIKNRENDLVKILSILVFIAPIPAGLTGDLFYPLRALDYLWVLAIIISFGCFDILKLMRNKIATITVIAVMLGYSLAAFGISYFVLFKYEEAFSAGAHYIRLIPKLKEYPDKKIVVDFSSRAWGVGIRSTYLMSAEPTAVQANLSSQLKNSYYSGDVNAQEIFKINNIVFQPLSWGEVCGDSTIFVGDSWTFAPGTIESHKLKLEFTVDNYLNQPLLFGYSSAEKCN